MIALLTEALWEALRDYRACEDDRPYRCPVVKAADRAMTQRIIEAGQALRDHLDAKAKA